MTDEQRRLLIRSAERAVELTKKVSLWRPHGRTLKIQGLVAQAWLEGYAQAVDDLKAHMKHK